MSDFFINFDGFAIYVRKKDRLREAYSHSVVAIESDQHFEVVRQRNPYANCIKIDFREQMFGKNLKRTLPKKIKDYVSGLEEAKAFIRDEKIKKILQ